MSIKKTTDDLLQKAIEGLEPPRLDPSELSAKMMEGIRDVLKENVDPGKQFTVDAGKLQTAYLELFGMLLFNLYRLAEPEQKVGLYVHLSRQIVSLLTHMKDGINDGKI